MRRPAHPTRWLQVAAMAGFAALAACGPTKFAVELNVPPPLVTRIPVVIGVYVPPEFANQVYEEKRRDYSISVAIGKAQNDGFLRLMDAMFDRAVRVNGTGPENVTAPEMRGILEPVLEDYSFITPRDSSAPVYAVSVKYRINGYNRQGQLFESWTFTGYGSVESSAMGLKGTTALKNATALAMRDAAAKLAAEFRDQAIVRGLLPANTPPPAPAGSPAAAASGGGAPAPASAPPSGAQPPSAPPPSGAPSGAQPSSAPPSGGAPSGAPPSGDSTSAPSGESEEAAPPPPSKQSPAPSALP